MFIIGFVRVAYGLWGSIFGLPYFFLCKDFLFVVRFSLRFQGFGGLAQLEQSLLFGGDKILAFWEGFPYEQSKQRRVGVVGCILIQEHKQPKKTLVAKTKPGQLATFR